MRYVRVSDLQTNALLKERRSGRSDGTGGRPAIRGRVTARPGPILPRPSERTPPPRAGRVGESVGEFVDEQSGQRSGVMTVDDRRNADPRLIPKSGA